MNKIFEKILRMTQAELMNYLRENVEGKKFYEEGAFLLIEGQVPIMLVSHLDTVHEEIARDIFTNDDGNIISSPQGIGGDDRCGVYALLEIQKRANKKPYLLFTCDEEIGRLGAKKFAESLSKIPQGAKNINLIVELDRRGNNDAVYYSCANKHLEKYISSKGFETAQGTGSDISNIAPALGIAAVNLSSAYYNAHRLDEFINLAELEKIIERVIEIVNESESLPKFEYVENFNDERY